MSRLEELIEEAVPRLREIGGFVKKRVESVLVAGDTHGYREATEWVLKIADKLNPELVVFLGDYVDRGPRGVENLELLLERFISEPHRYLLLRGNHESPVMNYYYGFREELVNKLGPEALRSVEQLYECLVLHAVINDVWLVHGGVPCRDCGGGEEPPVELDLLVKESEEIHCKEDALEPEGLVMQMLWNDPEGSIEWFAPSMRGSGIYLYGRKAWSNFLEHNGLKFILRAHETVDAVAVWKPDGGYEPGLSHGQELRVEDLHGTVVTVFTSLYHGRGAGAVYMTQDVFKVYRFPEEP
ncbi:metallophosphoesterase [Pyrofollis japonicus]|uniref:metallophosphoesterase n=1 Tax=Pyrofollis japonicus TaxID=3060460 RepID=UPI00295A744B|nr:metallophosphoesterase [Pyrofollis japonicus]BEP17773.1 metallophosphoesterase [Pyrofollis japonicus]